MTQEEILERGIRAASLLSSDLMGFLAEYKGDLMTAIANSEPHESKTRESLYYQHRALIDLEGFMNTYVTAAQQIASAETDPESGESEGQREMDD